jgi:hypothetical protein
MFRIREMGGDQFWTAAAVSVSARLVDRIYPPRSLEIVVRVKPLGGNAGGPIMINHRELAAQQRWEVLEALAALLTIGAVFCGVTLALANRMSRSPQIINLYVHLDQPARVQ